MGRSRRSGLGDQRSRGQSLAEFALVLPVVLLILLFTIDFGRVYLGWVQLNNAARIAANYAASGFPPLSPAQQAQYRSTVSRETAGLNCDLPSPIPDPTYPGSTGTTVGGRAVVSLTCSFKLLTPFIGALFPSGTVIVGASADFPIRTGAIANITPGQTIAPAARPNQDFTIRPSSGPAPLTVNFVLGPQQGGPAQTWAWDFGDGSTDTINPVPPAHQYTVQGTYPVTLVETNGSGQSTYSHNVVVGPPQPAPVAGFYGTVPSPCVTVVAPNSEQCGGVSGSPIYYKWPMTVTFTDTSLNNSGATYLWDFGDGSALGTTANPTHLYSAPGSFTVTQTVTTSAGANPFARNAYINAGCVIPVFINTNTSSANATWIAAHFLTGNLYYYQKFQGNFGYFTGAPSPGQSYTIGQQNPQGGLFTAASGSAGSYQCSTTGRVAKTGDPAP